MIKTYHEAPKSLFKVMQTYTDGDYALVHLFESDPTYYNLFVQALAQGRDVILDNSVFELGEAADGPMFAGWVRKLKPTWYIVPDVLEDASATIDRFHQFTSEYPDLPGKRIGVVQGESMSEVIRCYKALEPECDMMAFSFDFSWWLDLFPVGGDANTPTKWHSFARGRVWMLEELLRRKVINRYKPHHLLGVALPQEMKYYASMKKLEPGNWSWIRSVDTSNPVVHGLKGIAYDAKGLQDKETQKLHELINYAPDFEQVRLVISNTKMFRRFCSA
ncbi:MAG TPA: hypothetical protein GX745_08455 [Clostridiales bacterium]|nr:hypothetical protein [Clostridiales bacterium]